MAYELNENKYAGKFRNKTVVITGASSGIGRGTALAFGRAGANVVICGRAGELLEDLVDTINNLGGRAISVEADVSK
jgi:NAD(P)-dependent dehydrogenase (short-subunit alcohol dehydrogenase family)